MKYGTAKITGDYSCFKKFVYKGRNSYWILKGFKFCFDEKLRWKFMVVSINWHYIEDKEILIQFITVNNQKKRRYHVWHPQWDGIC